MFFVKLLVSAVLSWHAAQVKGGDNIPERTCAVFYASPNFAGDSFALEDFDMSSNLKGEFRHSVDGWTKTGSIEVWSGCQLTVCSDTYLTGTCQTLDSDQTTLSSSISSMQSASCDCDRECKCEDVVSPRNEFPTGGVIRAYVNGSCNECNSEYIWLQNSTEEVPEKFKNSVTDFVVPKDCNFTVCPGPRCTTFVFFFQDPVVPWRYGTASSYALFCDVATINLLPSVGSNGPLISLPPTVEELKKMMRAGPAWSNHAGIKAALQSAQNKRSCRNAYIFLLGNPKPAFLGFPHCRNGTNNKITECIIPVPVEELGIIAEVHVIVMPVGYNKYEEDYVLMAAMEKWWSTHEELKNILPNAVIIFQNLDDTQYTWNRSTLIRRYQFLHANRKGLVDENASNIVHILTRLEMIPAEVQKKPANYMTRYQDMFKPWGFPKPFSYCLRQTPKPSSLFVNGYIKMVNGEYFPKNLESALKSICEKGGDPLGKAILKAYFLDTTLPHFSIELQVHNVLVSDQKIKWYADLPYIGPVKT